MALDFRNMKKLTIGGIELKKLLINGIEVWKSFTNMIPLSINADGTQFVGTNGEDGWQHHARLNTSGAQASTTSDVGVTGFIPVKKGDIVYFKNMQVHPTNTGGKNDLTYLGLYLSDFSYKVCPKFSLIKNYSYIVTINTTYPDTGYVQSIKIVDQYNYGISYIRVSCGFLDSTAIITVNEPID